MVWHVVIDSVGGGVVEKMQPVESAVKNDVKESRRIVSRNLPEKYNQVMASSDETIDQPPRPDFDTTVWSMVMRAAHRSSPEGRLAFAQLCEAYWYPLYAYVRSLGNDVHQAQDLTQSFFEKAIEKNYVGDADPSRGKFRTFLLASLKNFLANEFDKRTTLKRGGDRKHVSLDFADADRRFRIESVIAATAEASYEQRWARTLLDRVLDQMRQAADESGTTARFDELAVFLTTDQPDRMSEIADRIGMTESAIRVAVHRLRAKYRTMLRDEIAATIGDPADVDAEIAALHSVFSKAGKN